MQFIQQPNLPAKPAWLVLVGAETGSEAIAGLSKLGIKALIMPPHAALYKAVESHPDMQLHHVGGNRIIYAPGTDRSMLDILSTYGFEMTMGECVLAPSYPFDIPYNAARVGHLYFHNLKYTDRVLREQLDRLGAEPVHVEQGYSKCSLLAVDENSIVTTDAGIARIAEKKGLDVLFLENECSIRLPGLNYGFIGGSCGMISSSVCAVNGCLEKLTSGEALVSFLSRKHITVKELSKDYVTDIGSILPLSTYNI
ncbi:MAG TPA: hypothetical protein VHT96_03900 [Clostridia bacterium]|nr:hypothetical protein [Clostridia bacterium]